MEFNLHDECLKNVSSGHDVINVAVALKYDEASWKSRLFIVGELAESTNREK